MTKKISSVSESKTRRNIAKPVELEAKQLRWNCPEDNFKFQTTREIEPLDKIVGQPRAIEAIRLGAELFAKGYNIFVTGLSGTGRLTTVKRILEEVTTVCPISYDYCYVNNFKDKDRPLLIKLNRGGGRVFANDMTESVNYLKQRLPQLFEEENFKASRREIIESFQAKEKEILEAFDQKIKPFGFIRGQLESEQGIVQPEVFPVLDDKPIQIEDLANAVREGKISDEEAEKIETKYREFHNEIIELARIGMKMMLEFKKELAENDKQYASTIVKSVISELREKHKNEKLNQYFEDVNEFILDNLELFIPPQNTNLDKDAMLEYKLYSDEKLSLFEVNVILDNTKTQNAPVVIETTPSYTNLFGTIERTFDSRGYWRTDFRKIKAGSILKADQGYLIVNALDMFSEQGVWQTLKRVLLYNKLEIQAYESVFQLSQLHLKPEPIDVNVKVIIIGGSSLYRYLYLQEKGFKKMFKVNAQFDYETKLDENMLMNYAGFIAKICNEENLPHCTPDGVAAIIEWAVEHAGSQSKVTLKFSDVSDIILEAAFYDRGSKRKYINREDVENAIKWRRYRNNLLDEKIKAQILEGNVMIDTEGQRVGQINGLTVLDTGILSFGKPSRITATISAGNDGIINIEREAKLSGSIHDKGVLILSSILRDKFAQIRPMSLTASIAFEQSYGGVDGDSATAAEIYAIISAISKIPISQSLAVTGSVNQKGDIQPVGGINQKIFGFYEICKDRGLTGKQGVIIPVQNADDLMLNQKIVDDVKNGLFHIYTFTRFEDAIELLMDKPAGYLKADGHYSKNSVFYAVEQVLDRLWEKQKEISNHTRIRNKKTKK